MIVLQEVIRAKDTARDKGRQCGRCRCKNLRTEGFAETALQATQRHVFQNSMFLSRLKSIDLRTCADCKQLKARHFQKHLVPRFLHRNHIARTGNTTLPADLAIAAAEPPNN